MPKADWTPADITRLRDRLRWTQEDLAARLGTRAATVSRWENAHARPHRVFCRQLDVLAAEATTPTEETR